MGLCCPVSRASSSHLAGEGNLMAGTAVGLVGLRGTQSQSGKIRRVERDSGLEEVHTMELMELW